MAYSIVMRLFGTQELHAKFLSRNMKKSSYIEYLTAGKRVMLKGLLKVARLTVYCIWM